MRFDHIDSHLYICRLQPHTSFDSLVYPEGLFVDLIVPDDPHLNTKFG
ncbi:hypothetical protein EST38_g8958 [Candolleomyces aberdarensis]|uniref:Uncharacterized protein n=1 Tax=Candolleomyces aberdarensis TaxID=2316362 RepID=A0A4Q2DDF9_9AGAR|nr:hypothetical protein EST38_g8958 [Candolleomyces aberdarensis]